MDRQLDEERIDKENAGPEPLAIVAVGASAGGLKAITALLGAVPVDSRLAFVVIQHRTPDNEGLLIGLLARITPLPVHAAADGLALEANHVYVASAGQLTSLEEGRLRVRAPQLPDNAALPIDLFFRTLATDQREKAIVVVLSGTGADGTYGLRAVKEYGGLVVVQDPATAAFDGMPCSAIATGMADYVLAPSSIPAALVDFVRQPYLGPAMGQKDVEGGDAVDDPAFHRILALLAAQTKRDHRAYKAKTLVRRIERRMGIHQIADMAEYLVFLGTHPAEIEQLSRDVLISVTRFFRDAPAFAALATDLVGPLVAERAAGHPVRVWVPACATGEEAYSIAILLMEACAKSGKPLDVKVFGSDVDSRALTVARAGLYPETIAADVSAERLAQFFTPVKDGYRVAKALRDMVTFAQHNLLNDPPFSNLDLISCRNALIYIEPAVQKVIFGMFHFGLAAEGVLFLGSAETVNGRSDLFGPLSQKWRLYRKLGTARGTALALPASVRLPAAVTALPNIPTRGNSPAEVTRQALLLEYAPAAVLIDPQHRVQYLFGPTGDFLDLPMGEPPWDLTAMTRGELRLKLREVIAQAAATRSRVRIAGIRHKHHGASRMVAVTVIPVRFPKDKSDLLVVTFADAADVPVQAAPPDEAPAPPFESDQFQQLEYELRVTQEELNVKVEELGAAHEALRIAGEEMLSIGEEYQSTNEELETSKEELQSLNEELSTLNAQLHEKVEELETTTNDLTNLLSSSDIATVFLATDLRIKRFTPTATRLFSLLPQDAGRPITDITRHFADPHLVEDVHATLASLAPLEREVAADGDATFLRRIQPYRTQSGRIEGAVITFSDVTALKRTSLALALRARQHQLIADLGRMDPVGQNDPDTLTEAARMIAEALEVDGVAILGPSASSGAAAEGMENLVLLGAAGLSVTPEERVGLSPNRATLAGRVFRSRQPLIVADFTGGSPVRSLCERPDRRMADPMAAGSEMTSGLGVAFGDRGRTPFVLALGSREAGHFSENDIEFAQTIASVLGAVLERARILDETRADRDFAEAIVNTVREPLLVLDDALRVVGASAAFHRTFGSVPADTIGYPLWTVVAGGLAEPALREALERIIPDDAVVDALEIAVDPGNDERRLLLNARRMSRGNLILLAMEDITERARVRQALADAKMAAEQASASKTRFLAAASHDLRQPAQALTMFQHLLNLQPMTEPAAKLLSNMGSSLGALTSMLDDILDVSRLDAGIIEVSPRPHPLHATLASLYAETAPLADVAGLTLRYVPTSLVVRSDPALLMRILRNFLANAIKYTDEGCILMGCRRSGDHLRVQVWDTGQGIPQDQLSAIFEEFHQVGNVERDRRQGLGLGLAIVERLAGLLGHPIQVRSRLGAGSVFEVLVPLADPNDPMPGDDEAMQREASNGERVLVIDDDTAVLNGIEAFLKDEGYDVVATPDGATALERLRGNPPDLVIADFRLKGPENGAETIRRLEQRLGTRLPGILLTGDTSPLRIREAINSGFLLLHKPLSPDDLLRAIQRALDRS
ncbi:CheR family methyltransferase [Azospirillum doebereinerae]|uniref:CheR family methyltransferase n=1 Tax=Azospirillum doebereinerae TaxID=92933 RepID=UPI001FCF7C5F|nr:chemotaxis protein CheB [Azospirillum doebereinerae]